jgi:surfeit locus 1 family protein
MSPSRYALFALTVAVAAAASGLGAWQLGRHFDRRDRNRQAVANAGAEVVDLTMDALQPPIRHRRVTARGSYDEAREFVIRGRLLHGNPGAQIVTPLRIPGRDTALLVNRGFVPSPDAGFPRRGGYAESGPVVVAGVALDLPDEGDGHPLATAAGETWGRLDRTQMRARLPYPIWPYYLVAGVDSTVTRDHTLKGRVLPVRIEVPPLDAGPHLSYAVQWFGIAAAALAFGIVFVRRGRGGTVPG